MKLFLQKKCKVFERWELRPQTPVPPAAGGFAPNPQHPAAGGFAPRPPLASSGWGLRPQTSKTAPPLHISGYAPGTNTCLNWVTGQLDTRPCIFLPIGPANVSRPLVAPSKAANTCRKGSSFVCSKHTTHWRGLCNNSSKLRMHPLCLPVIEAVPSVPTIASLCLPIPYHWKNQTTFGQLFYLCHLQEKSE